MMSRPVFANTQNRILTYLKEHPNATVPEISKLIMRTPADIRYHIKILLEQHKVEVSPVPLDLPKQRGRPVIQYRLSPIRQTDSLDNLCQALLEFIGSKSSPDLLDLDLQQIASLVAAKSQSSGPLSQRIRTAVDFFDRFSYQPRWEATASGPRFFLSHCPFSTIIAAHPELCKIDQFILQNFLKNPIQQITKINQLTGSPKTCIFHMNTKQSES